MAALVRCAIEFLVSVVEPGPNRSVWKNSLPFSICACHPCAGAMLIFSVSFQFYRIFPEGNPWIHEKRQPQAWRLGASRWGLSVGVAVGASASLVVSALEAFASETPSGGLGDGVQRSSPCLAQHVDGITPRNQVVCKVAVMQIAAIWQLTTWGTAEAGNRASKTGRYLEWWDNGPECLAMTSGECKVHHNTLFVGWGRARPVGAPLAKAAAKKPGSFIAACGRSRPRESRVTHKG